jgi:DNA-binding LacI/PurR family transcriptional regulator
MAGVEAYLSRHDYHILLTSIDSQAMARPQDFSVINQRRVDGLILAGPDISPSFVLGLVTSGVPLILVDNCLSHTVVDCVLNDDEGGAYSATNRLLEYGHTRIVFLSGPREWVSNRERMRGYRRAVEETGLEPLVLHGAETTIASGKGMMQQALERWPDLTAVFGVNDAVAIGAIRAAAGLGRHIPKDLSVIGFDDVSWAAMNEPPLSTVHVFKRRMGELAAQRLLECIRHPGLPPSKVIVSTKLLLRDSCCHRV